MNKIQNLFQTIQDDEKVIQGLEEEIKLLNHKLSHAQGVKRCHEEALKRAQTEFYPEDEPVSQKKDLYSQCVIEEAYERINKDIPEGLPEEYHNYKITRLTVDNYQELLYKGANIFTKDTVLSGDLEEGVHMINCVESENDYEQPFMVISNLNVAWPFIDWDKDEVYLLEEL